MKCDKCDSAYINGHFCHEHGCPNTYKHYDKEEDVWVEIFTCRECGFELPIGEDTCDCTEPVDDDEEMYSQSDLTIEEYLHLLEYAKEISGTEDWRLEVYTNPDSSLNSANLYCYSDDSEYFEMEILDPQSEESVKNQINQ